VFVGGDVDAAWFVAKRAAADGAPLWRTDLAGAPGNAVVRGLALRPGGAPVVAGRLFAAASGQDFVVVALAADGTEQWRYVLDGTAVDAADVDEAFALAVDAAGDVIAGGVLSNAGTDDDLVVVKLDGTAGTEDWRVVVDGSNSNNDDASAVAIDPDGNALVVGSIRNPGSGRDLAVLLLDGASGVERWRRLLDGATSQGDVGFAAGIAGADAVLAAGRTRNGETVDGLTVLKLATATGADFPCGTGTIEGDEVCDDANLTLGDGCRPDCTAELCGDGIEDPQETCDDGNTEDGDCCSALCAADANGATCDDADACTSGDMCTGGVCQGGTPTVCPASNDCHDGSCDPATGLCSDVPRPDGRLCNDGDACTVVDECVAGACSAGSERPCDDYDPCTADSCAPATGCVYQAYESFAGVSCAFDPPRLDTFCFAGLPRAIEHAIERAAARVEKAAASPKVGRAKRLLKSARNLTEQARRRAAKQTAKGELSPACGAALADVLADVGGRALALRETLAAGQ
jgi:cysteine-rich repeat protein